ncbi:MAG: hypothetical protein H6R26_2814 [Proteobacteria bacterium]|nr:hypothetical protein [Pseudomonadota bacterium]
MYAVENIDTCMRSSRAVFWGGLAAVTVLSLLPASYLPPVAFDLWDKAQHAFAYAGLALAGLIGWRERRAWLVIGLLCHAAAIELAQALLTWRTGDVLDWAADAIGVTLVWVVLRAQRARRN